MSNHAKIITLLLTVILGSSMHDAFVLNSTIFLSANQSTTWINNNYSLPQSVCFLDGSLARFILFQGPEIIDLWSYYFSIGCGFVSTPSNTDSYYLAIFTVKVSAPSSPPEIVWLANRDSPVGENAALKFSQDGNLVLFDADSNEVWSTDTSNKHVTGMMLTESGKLVLFDRTYGTVWQSSGHPTDTLVVGQVLEKGQVLTSRSSPTNWSRGMFSLSISSSSLSAFVQMNMPIEYLKLGPPWKLSKMGASLLRVRFNEGDVTFFYETVFGPQEFTILIPKLSPIQLLRLDSDGGLRIYGWSMLNSWVAVYTFSEGWDECLFPLKCGKYGLCKQGQCTCPTIPGEHYFSPVHYQLPSLGCDHIIYPISDMSYFKYRLEDFGNLSYFGYADPRAAVPGLQNLDKCRQAYLDNSSCKAAFFKYRSNESEGHCHLLSEVLTVRGDPISSEIYNSVSLIKVKVLTRIPTSIDRNGTHSGKLVTKSRLMNVTIVFLFAVMCFVLLLVKIYRTCKGKDHFEKLTEMPKKFKYKDLEAATRRFSEELGKGGFGAMFKGVLRDGTRVAVKRLDNDGQGMKEFLAEVKTLGNINHVNLVKLIGFCATKSHWLLVYEYMSNGSLDNWIFDERKSSLLDWKTRKKILVDVAKGLAYLHEDCRQRIAHLDVKPHNILLDDNFNAKLSDFGLSKLINPDESQVIMSFRGTLGYLAPEWGHSHITVKADIYSFGIVLVELVCGRKNMDLTGPKLDMRLLTLLQNKAEKNRLVDIVDRRSDDMQCHGEEAATVIRIGLWCLNDNHTRRPLMSTVVKVLEGITEFDSSINGQSFELMASFHEAET